MDRSKRYVVTGVSRLTGGLIVTNVEPYTGQAYVPTRPATGGVSWLHWAVARNPRAARRASIRAHDAYIAAEIALCGPDRFVLATTGIARTDAGFNRE